MPINEIERFRYSFASDLAAFFVLEQSELNLYELFEPLTSNDLLNVYDVDNLDSLPPDQKSFSRDEIKKEPFFETISKVYSAPFPKRVVTNNVDLLSYSKVLKKYGIEVSSTNDYFSLLENAISSRNEMVLECYASINQKAPDWVIQDELDFQEIRSLFLKMSSQAPTNFI
ncbi:hypothetical protein AB6D24_03890 [Vibrio splendidus]